MKELSHELGRPLTRMCFVPVACNHQKVSTDQLQAAVGHRFVDHDLRACRVDFAEPHQFHVQDRKSTRLNSSHGYISYAVFCLKKKKIISADDACSCTHVI